MGSKLARDPGPMAGGSEGSRKEWNGMCGICGVLNTDSSPADAGLLQKMIAAVRHRGPDDCGIYTKGNAGLGHARLSIIDLAGGHQPMQSADGELAIAFNGEIFNYIELREELEKRGHRFVTTSDTEVILHQYQEDGEECVHRFNGQWAFAIWDQRKRKLFLSRDRMGIRPLFYSETNRGFLFASEIKALLAAPNVRAELDLFALDQIFTFWATIPPRTALKGISQLPPGCSLVVDDCGVQVTRYWSLAFPEESGWSFEDERELAGELRQLLLDATRIRLRADVPVGAYLSGGIDSTVTTALAASIVGNRLRSFSISFDDAEYDEKHFQTEASNFLKTDHSSFACSPSDIGEAFAEVIWHAEQPVLRTAPAPMFLLSRLVRESGFKVVLTGEGADEVLGGYDIFKEAKIRRFWARDLSSRWRPLLLKRLYPYMDGIQRQSPAYLRHFFRVSESDLASPFFSHLPRWELTARLKLLLSDDVRSELGEYNAFDDLEQALPAEYGAWRPFNQAEYLEATGLLPGYILSSQGDRMAMAHSVEGRFPFLDYRVVEFAAKLPPNLKMKGLTEKYLLKRAFTRDVPASILKRTKQPYRAPEGKCFFGACAPEWVKEALSHRAIQSCGIFDARAVSVLADKFKSGRPVSTKDNMALTGVLSTQLLLNRFSGGYLNSCTQWRSDLKYATLS